MLKLKAIFYASSAYLLVSDLKLVPQSSQDIACIAAHRESVDFVRDYVQRTNYRACEFKLNASTFHINYLRYTGTNWH